MALGKYRTRFAAVGLGNLEVLEKSPSAGTEFLNAGHLDQQGTEVGELYEEEILRDERGNVSNILYHTHAVTHASSLQQVGIDEINLIRNSRGKVHALRYSGMVNPDLFQYFCYEQAKINPNFARRFVPGKAVLPFRAMALKQDDASFDIPEVYVIETNGRIRTQNLQLWVAPRIGLNTETTKLLDISGWARHGTLNSDFATIWQQTTNPAEFLRFDGANDQVSFGNILNDDGVSDFMIEGWVRIQGADGSKQEILAKKSQFDINSAGFGILRTASNFLQFQLGDGATLFGIIPASTILQNVWKHFAVVVDRNGNATFYMNAVAGSPSSIAAMGTAANALDLYLGRDGTAFGQVDKGDVRFYNFGAGGLPSDIATIIANHFAAERSFYGV